MKGLKNWLASELLVAVLGMWAAGAAGQESMPTLTLRFEAEAGEEYEIQWTSSLAEGSWSVLDSWMAESDGEATLEVAVPENAVQSFFRIALASDGQTVLTANAVGQTVFGIPAGGVAAVSVPYENPESGDGLFRFGETGIAEGLPVGSWVFFRNGGKWGGGKKSAFGWDPAESNRVLQVGEGFWVRNGGGEAVEVVASGEVPSDLSLDRDYEGDSAWSAMANPYPVDAVFGNTSLAMQLQQASCVAFWEPGMQSWDVYTKSARGWSSAAANRVLGAGEAFFVQSATEGTWTESKPYTWP